MHSFPHLNQIYSFIATHELIPQGSKVIVGLSGGPDSVFLLHFLVTFAKQHKITLIAAHLDHEWRPESGQDAKFCQDLAQSLGILCVTRKISDLGLSLKFNGSKEAIARQARRHFFAMAKKETDADLIALAHHAQDQQETFFIRMMRGATLTGLTGIKPRQDGYVRPLLQTNKQDILNYLHTNNIAYLTDSTNASDAYLRNRIRMHVLPALQKCDTRFDANFLSTMTRLQETEQFLQELTAHIFEQIAQLDNCAWHLEVDKLFTMHTIMQYRLVLYWLCQENVQFPTTESFFDEILRFLHTPDSGTHAIYPTWSLVKKNNLVWIKK